MKKTITLLIALFISCILFSQTSTVWTELKPQAFGFEKFLDSRDIIYSNRNNTGFWFYQDWQGKPVFKTTDNKSYVLPSLAGRGDRPIIIDDTTAFFVSPLNLVWYKPDEKNAKLLGGSKGSVGDVQHAVANDSCLYMVYTNKDSCRIVSINTKVSGKLSVTETIATLPAKSMKIYPSGNSLLMNGDYLFVYLSFNEDKDATLADYVYSYNLQTKAYKKIKTSFDDFSNLANINDKPVLIKRNGKAFSINPASGQLVSAVLPVTLSKTESIKKVIIQKNACIILTSENSYISKDNTKSFIKIAHPEIADMYIEDARTEGSVLYLYVSVGDELVKKLFKRSI